MAALEYYTVGRVFYAPISLYMMSGRALGLKSEKEPRFGSLEEALAEVDAMVARNPHGQIPVYRHKRFGRGEPERVANIDIDQRRRELGIPLEPEPAVAAAGRPALSEIETAPAPEAGDLAPRAGGIDL